MTAAKIYPRQFEGRIDGLANYFPEDKTELGDVGFYQRTTGRFLRLFNILVAADHQLNSLGVPTGFFPFSPRANHIQFDDKCLLPQPIVSKSVVSADISLSASGGPAVNIGAGLSYKCLEEQGAVLLFGSRMARADILDNDLIEDYMEEHVDSWYDFAKSCGFGPKRAPEGSIVLIRGCDKAPSYALAAFWKQKKEASISFQGGFIKGGDLRLHLQGSWEKSDAAEYREGPPRYPAEDEAHTVPPSDDQGRLSFPFFAPDCVYTLFARIYKIKRKNRLGRRIPIKLAAAAGPHQLPRGDFDKDASAAVPSDDSDDCEFDWDSDGEFEIDLDQSTDYGDHPLDDVVDFILDAHPDVSIAIATEEDMNAHLNNDDSPNLGEAKHSAQVAVRGRGIGRVLKSPNTADSDHDLGVQQALVAATKVKPAQSQERMLNEFCKLIGPWSLESFEDWNPDKSIWKAAEDLYNIDNLELYVGMQTEAAERPVREIGRIQPSVATRELRSQTSAPKSCGNSCTTLGSDESQPGMFYFSGLKLRTDGVPSRRRLFISKNTTDSNANTRAVVILTKGQDNSAHARTRRLRNLCKEVLAWRDLSHFETSPALIKSFSSSPTLRVRFGASKCPLKHRHYAACDSNDMVEYPDLLTQIAAGLAYLHGQKVTHGDLRGPNILVHDDDRASITDFGLSSINCVPGWHERDSFDSRGNHDCTVQIWESPSGTYAKPARHNGSRPNERNLLPIGFGDSPFGIMSARSVGHPDSIMSVGIFPDQSWFPLQNSNSTIRPWDTPSRGSVAILKDGPSCYPSVTSFPSPNGCLLTLAYKRDARDCAEPFPTQKDSPGDYHMVANTSSSWECPWPECRCSNSRILSPGSRSPRKTRDDHPHRRDLLDYLKKNHAFSAAQKGYPDGCRCQEQRLAISQHLETGHRPCPTCHLRCPPYPESFNKPQPFDGYLTTQHVYSAPHFNSDAQVQEISNPRWAGRLGCSNLCNICGSTSSIVIFSPEAMEGRHIVAFGDCRDLWQVANGD